LLTLGRGGGAKQEKEPRLVSFELSQERTDNSPAPPAPEQTSEVAATAPPVPVPPAPLPPQARSQPIPKPAQQAPSSLPVPTPIIELPNGSMANLDIRSLPAALSAPRRAAGPPSPGPSRGDTPLAEGRGPNGEKLYAAAWYREPYDSELRGYLSTAQGPGYALIACKTVPDFRVDDCVALDEYPTNSRLARAVLAAAWQFRVRPPQLGGQMMVGEWVRIRIDYRDRAKG
jgi:protein TonB